MGSMGVVHSMLGDGVWVLGLLWMLQHLLGQLLVVLLLLSLAALLGGHGWGGATCQLHVCRVEGLLVIQMLVTHMESCGVLPVLRCDGWVVVEVLMEGSCRRSHR